MHEILAGMVECRIRKLEGWDRRMSVVEMVGKRKRQQWRQGAATIVGQLRESHCEQR